VRIRVEDITAEAKDLRFSEPQTEINRLLALGPIREYEVSAPVDVRVSYYRAGMDLFFEGALNAHTMATCARCAEQFRTSADRGFRFVLTPKSVGDEDESGLRIEDLELSTYDGAEVDLSPLINEQILLGLPTRPLCSDECRGLCPGCGTNLNQSSCGCAAAAADPRFAALRSIRVQRS
jgi:uncharacterized protein